MDLTRFKPGQLQCVKTLDAPLVVSAGAGSGKTFTLTQRIAWALMEGSAPDGGAFLDGIEQVMAITFTEKAAGEIKSRVKSTLRAEGMADEAVKVDDAWISTIHGMCSRILRTHAVELGIDPAFSVIGPAQADEMKRAAVQRALAGTNEFIVPEGFDGLFAEYAARSTGGFSSDSVEDMVLALVSKASAHPSGCACFVKPPCSVEASSLVRAMAETIEEARDAAMAQKQSAARDTWLQKAEAFLSAAYAMLSDAESPSPRGVLSLFDGCAWPAGTFGSKEYKACVKDMQQVCAQIVQQARHLVVEPLVDRLVDLASSVCDAYALMKRQAGVLDNDDLLLEAARALAEHPAIAQRYADKFKIVMVDEFQDTDQLQVDMIKRMAGPGACRLCTVGDAQQSIYRFRGADVQVYKRHLATVKAIDPGNLIELPDNFRSHGDVLKLVDRIFEQPQVFGAEFMSLSPARDEGRVKQPFRGGGRRVDVLLSTYPARKGIDVRDMVLFEARRIARRFSELKDRGHAAGDMVVLLGRMTNASLFARALREEGFACVIAGGSTFSSAPEVRVMQRLAEVIANPHATSALFEVLASDMFVLSADDLLALATSFDESTGALRRRGLDKGIADLAEAIRDGRDVSDRLAHAAKVLGALAQRAGRVPVSELMEYAVRESGWFTRLEARGAEGQSVAGNVLKAIRLAEDIEAAGAAGPSSVARGMAAHIDIAKEAPGALSAQGGDFVRIMTVHASKGLEFPIVAIAEMGEGAARSSAFTCTSVEGKEYLDLSPRRSVAGYGSSSPVKKAMDKQYRPVFEGGFEDVSDLLERSGDFMERRAILEAYQADQELQERRRLLYVALTRAKEALVVSMVSARSSADDSGIAGRLGIYDDIRSALFGAGDIPAGETSVDFGGSAPALVSRVDVDPDDLDAGGLVMPGEPARESGIRANATEGTPAGLVGIPRVAAFEAASGVRLRSPRADVASYSALAAAAGIEDRPSAVGEIAAAVSSPDEDGAFWDSLCDELLHDADKATDLGTAFHLLAQQAVRAAASASDGMLCRPPRSRIDAVARACGLGPSARERLGAALDRWFASDIARMCEQADFLEAELPFFMELGKKGEAGDLHGPGISYLEGSIDLFASWKPEGGMDSEGGSVSKGGFVLEDSLVPKGARALIVDYKTGGSPDETPDGLREKHRLQASCYAYVALMRGYAQVDAVFVRVEQPDARCGGQPHTVRYEFSPRDIPALRARIEEACRVLEARRGGSV